MCHCQVSLRPPTHPLSTEWQVCSNSPIFFFSHFAGDVCGGHCCDNRTEADVLRKSMKIFEGLIKHQLKSLKGLWESTHSIYKGKSGGCSTRIWCFRVAIKLWESLVAVRNESGFRSVSEWQAMAISCARPVSRSCHHPGFTLFPAPRVLH